MQQKDLLKMKWLAAKKTQARADHVTRIIRERRELTPGTHEYYSLFYETLLRMWLDDKRN